MLRVAAIATTLVVAAAVLTVHLVPHTHGASPRATACPRSCLVSALRRSPAPAPAPACRRRRVVRARPSRVRRLGGGSVSDAVCAHSLRSRPRGIVPPELLRRTAIAFAASPATAAVLRRRSECRAMHSYRRCCLASAARVRRRRRPAAAPTRARAAATSCRVVPPTDRPRLKNLDEYYTGDRNNVQHANVRAIIDTVIAALLADSTRTFT